ncbi:MAG: sensor domain-containing diguanylate cyclase [Candidatus Glassbacteria bacterium]|nr:sensor domain-containing diguanylate cyclase [Candidatus Glassbacteria bacterium]
MSGKHKKNEHSPSRAGRELSRPEELKAQYEKKIGWMRVLMDIGNALNSTLELEKLFDLIVDSAIRELQAGLGSLMILDQGFLTVKAARGMSEDLIGRIRIPLGESVTGWVAEHAEPLLLEDITRDKRFGYKDAQRRYASNSCLSVPIMHKGEVLGVLNCTDKAGGGVFTGDDLEFMITLASQAAVAIVNARMMDHIRELADHDDLTGLYNHRYLIDRLAAETERVDRYQTKPLSLVIIDIDHFKKVNDTYGHQAGNEVLKKLAETLVKATRRVDVICRYGGEEFVILLPEITSSKARSYMERVRKNVEKLRVTLDSTVISITVSAGIADYPVSCADADKLIGCADRALYRAKSEGRNCVRIHGSGG